MLFWLEFYNYLSNKTQRDDYIQNITIIFFCVVVAYLTECTASLLREMAV